ncbi:glycerophosphocholine cholinephosphodiesterase ENPP6-like [Mytilus californianus]|uniref:glycerophosphocholine cholinephosphodiesterase ENPP6-like n=1 Tax=Mytilus californianus TaxID=6549 RepID=UPI002245CCFD|nr:glycerophosphocholine cholinephosphodiesterase ENPP6-like [Mytilus californianus]
MTDKAARASMTSQIDENRKLLVLLIDGFRWDYFDIPGLQLPGFSRLFEQGVKADYMIPDFPTLSFPNFSSLMTGLHAEDHGFVGNFMYHEEKQSSFEYKMVNLESNQSHWFEGAEPLWISAVKQGKKSYMFEWPGCHVPVYNMTSTFCDKMNEWPMVERTVQNLKKAVDLLKADKIDFAGVYLNAVDRWGHSYGPNSKEVFDILKQTDNAIHEILSMLKTYDLAENTNLVIFSDHGMTEISESRTIDISEHIGSMDVTAVMDKGAVCSIWPREGKLDKVYTGLTEMGNSHMRVFKKDTIPDRWRYRNNKMIAPIIVVADLGWYILTPDGPSIDKYMNGPAKGHHGYDNAEEDMRGIFLAMGPDFKKNYKTGPVRAVDIYQVMCKALKIQPLPHKGDWSRVKDIFK